jgi:hypothetical protein
MTGSTAINICDAGCLVSGLHGFRFLVVATPTGVGQVIVDMAILANPFLFLGLFTILDMVQMKRMPCELCRLPGRRRMTARALAAKVIAMKLREVVAGVALSGRAGKDAFLVASDTINVDVATFQGIYLLMSKTRQCVNAVVTGQAVVAELLGVPGKVRVCFGVTVAAGGERRDEVSLFVATVTFHLGAAEILQVAF